MENGNGNGFALMPQSPTFPWIMLQNERPRDPDERPENYVPPRVRVALQFLSVLAAKQAAVPVKWGPQGLMVEGVGGADVATGGVEVVPGQKLTDEEAAAQATACNLLGQYFAGQLPPLPQERLPLAKRRNGEGGVPLARCKIICPSCADQPQYRHVCGVCSKRGYVEVPYYREVK